jgi:hypothetical protein
MQSKTVPSSSQKKVHEVADLVGGSMRSVASLVSIVTVLIARVSADELEPQRKALELIVTAADQICKDIPLDQSSLELSGEAKAELTAVLAKLASLGIKGAAEFSQSQGVLQKISCRH